MANITVSASCNQECAYCFGWDHLGRGSEGRSGAEEPGNDFLDVDVFSGRLDFLVRSGIAEARLLGGEPTLHPRFPDLVHRSRAAGLKVILFSNGLMPEEALRCLEVLDPHECTVLVNVNEPPPGGQDAGLTRQRETLRRLGRRAFPGFTLCRTDARPEFLLPLILETGCKPAIRFSMAQPCLSGENIHLHPNQYRAVAPLIVRLAEAAGAAGVVLDLDCGFVRCMFSDEEMAALRTAGAKTEWRCSPILDLDLAGNALYCYPLSRLAHLPVEPDTDAPALRRAFAARVRPYRQAGVYRECSSCVLKERGECSGGCLAATIRRFRRTPFAVTLPARSGNGGDKADLLHRGGT